MTSSTPISYAEDAAAWKLSQPVRGQEMQGGAGLTEARLLDTHN